MRKRLLSGLLSVCLAAGLIGTPVQAEPVAGSESETTCTQQDDCEAVVHDSACPMYVAQEPNDLSTPKDDSGVLAVEESNGQKSEGPNKQGDGQEDNLDDGKGSESKKLENTELPNGKTGDENEGTVAKVAPNEEENNVVSDKTADLQRLLEDLPSAEMLPDMSDAEKDEIYQEVVDLYDAIQKLSDEEQEKISVQKALDLLEWFNQQAMTIQVVASGTCGAQGNENNVNWELTQNNDDNQNPTYTLTISGNGAMMGYESASQVPWYQYANQITVGVVEEGITDLGARAFVLQKNLTSVTLPQSLQTIGDSAFNQCGLKTIKFPSNLKVIGKHAFWKSPLEGVIEFPETIEVIDSFAFEGCALTEITLPKNLKVLGSGAFKSTSITKMPEIPVAITSLVNTFQGCKQLTEISIPEHVTVLDRAFMECTGLTTVTIPEHVESYTGAFNGCTGLVSATIESKADNIGGDNTNNAYGVFGGCTNLKTVVVPEWVTTIGIAAFKNCTSLTTTDFIERADVIGWEAFQGCTALKGDLNLSAKELGAYAFDKCTGLGPDISIASASVTGENAFRGATGINGIVYALKLSGGANRIPSSSVAAITNGGSIPKDTVLSKDTLATPVYEGRTFGGWYDKDGTESGNWGNKVTVPEDKKTYYAKWIGMDDLALEYGETKKIVSSGEIESVTGYQSENEQVATVDADGNVTATGVGTTKITATGSYNGSVVFSCEVTVTPRVLAYQNQDGAMNPVSITYNYKNGHTALPDVMKLVWKSDMQTEQALVEGTDIDYTYMVDDGQAEGGGTAYTYDYLPMPVGEYEVVFNLKNPNYTFALADDTTGNTLNIQVKVAEQGATRAYLAAVAPAQDYDLAYAGANAGKIPVAGVLQAYESNDPQSGKLDIGTFTINIEGLNDTTFHSEKTGIAAGTDLADLTDLDLPALPGTYIITASAEGKDGGTNYYLYKSLVFQILKKDLTVAVSLPEDTIYVGDALPCPKIEFLGLVPGEELSVAEPLFEGMPSGTETTGRFTISLSAQTMMEIAQLPAAVNYTISWQPATLTIQEKLPDGSGDGDGDSGQGTTGNENSDKEEAAGQNTPAATATPVPQNTAVSAASDVSNSQTMVIPQTEDNSNPMLWSVVCLISALALAGLAVYKRKRSE